MRISTHTPVRVWLGRQGSFKNYCWISTHTPVRVWLYCMDRGSKRGKFQLTHPWGCDLVKSARDCLIGISTHTPVRVWHIYQWGADFPVTFQLTHPWGCDRKLLFSQLGLEWFQLTHPWGCDFYFTNSVQQEYISTHTPVRVWLKILQLHPKQPWISTHTPVRVWLDWDSEIYVVCDFNSHTREGVTSWLTVSVLTMMISTHTPVRVWLFRNIHSCGAFGFQLTHPWGCDMILEPLGNLNCNFNSHTREGVTYW